MAYLRKLDGSRPPEEYDQIPVEINEAPAPTIGVEDAVSRLDVSEEPFVFFHDRVTGEACVLFPIPTLRRPLRADHAGLVQAFLNREDPYRNLGMELSGVALSR